MFTFYCDINNLLAVLVSRVECQSLFLLSFRITPIRMCSKQLWSLLTYEHWRELGRVMCSKEKLERTLLSNFKSTCESKLVEIKLVSYCKAKSQTNKKTLRKIEEERVYSSRKPVILNIRGHYFFKTDILKFYTHSLCHSA